jgi:hypothetical protein
MTAARALDAREASWEVAAPPSYIAPAAAAASVARAPREPHRDINAAPLHAEVERLQPAALDAAPAAVAVEATAAADTVAVPSAPAGDPRLLLDHPACIVHLMHHCLDAASLVALSQVDRKMLDFATRALAWRHIQMPIAVTLAQLTAIATATRFRLREVRFALTVEPIDKSRPLTRVQHILFATMRVTELHLPYCFALEQTWRAAFSLKRFRESMAFVELTLLWDGGFPPSAQIVADVCGLPNLTHLRIPNAAVWHCASIAACRRLARLELRCQANAYAALLQSIFDSESLATSLVELDIGSTGNVHEYGSAPLHLTGVGYIAALQSVSLGNLALHNIGQWGLVASALHHIASLRRVAVIGDELLLAGVDGFLGHLLWLCPQVNAFEFVLKEDAAVNTAAVRDRLQAYANDELQNERALTVSVRHA